MKNLPKKSDPVSQWKRSGKFNKHHLTAKCRGGESISSNLLRLDIRRHNALHVVFLNFTLSEIIFLLSYVKQVMQSYIFNKVELKNIVILLIRINSVYYSEKEVKKVKSDAKIRDAWTFLFKDKSIDEILNLFIRLKRIKGGIVMSNYLSSKEIQEILNKKANVFSSNLRQLA